MKSVNFPSSVFPLVYFVRCDHSRAQVRSLRGLGRHSFDLKKGFKHHLLGVRAMIMDCVRSGWSGEAGEERYEFRTLRTKRGMLVVLAGMTERDQQDAVEYLAPWKLFNERRAKPRNDFQSGVFGEIIGTLRDLEAKFE